MAVTLLQLVTSLFFLLTNLLSFVVTQVAALLASAFVQLKLSGDATGDALEAFRGLVGAGTEYVARLWWDVLLMLVTAAFQAVVGVASMLFEVASVASAELSEMARNGVDNLLQFLRAVIEGAAEAAGEAVLSVLKNLVTAVGNAMETAATAESSS